MRVLVACEESQAVCLAFRHFGHNAFSCDIQPCSGGHPEFHIQDDVISHLEDVPPFFYDLIIAHPPCTYLSCVSSVSLSKDPSRIYKLRSARDFFMYFYDYPFCNRICIENPRALRIANLPKFSQVIQPYDFGDNWSKQTLLWLRGLPPLFPNVIEYNRRSAAPSYVASVSGSVKRSKSFPGIAFAMAKQWSFGA